MTFTDLSVTKDPYILFAYLQKDLPKMIIRGGRVINEDQSFEADVYIVGNKIKYDFYNIGLKNI